VNYQGLDAILVSGDICNTGYRRDLLRGLRFLDGPAVSNNIYDAHHDATLGFLNPGCTLVLPGNHDRYRRIPVYFPGGTAFDAVFGAHWRGGFHGVWAWCVPNVVRNLVIVGADFALGRRDFGRFHYSLPGWLGQGRVNAKTLQDLVNATRKLRLAQASGTGCAPLILWAVHFDPFASDGSLQLLESGKLVEAAQAEHVPIILAGHTHETKVKPTAKMTGILPPAGTARAIMAITCGTTAQAGASQGNDFQVLTFTVPDDGGGATTLSIEVYRYHGLRRFVHIKSDVSVLVS
jgi:hypothetical protein